MSKTGGTRAWKFLRRNPGYIEAQREAPEAAREAAPFPMRVQTEADLDASAWGLVAWEDPLDEAGPASPFWIGASTLEATPAAGAPALAELLGVEDAGLSGLRLRDGAAVVKVECGAASVQIRIADGDAFDPAGGVTLAGLPPAVDLHERLRRVAALWPIGGAETKKDACGFRTRSFCSRSTAGWPAEATA